jgi:hypothetical protein
MDAARGAGPVACFRSRNPSTPTEEIVEGTRVTGLPGRPLGER